MKRRDIINMYGESAFDGRTIGLIGTACLQLLVFVLMTAIGAVALVFISGAYEKLFAENLDIAEYVKELIDNNLVMVIVGGVVFLLFYLFGLAWSQRIGIKWVIRHTVINEHRLAFDGKAIQLFGNMLKWVFFTVITLGIFIIWIPVKFKKWEVKHTYFENPSDLPAVNVNGYAPNAPAFIAPPVYIQTTAPACPGKCPPNNGIPYTPYTFGNSCPYNQNNKND